jgi:RNA polymerase sigma factor (sigma-70 family)
VRSDGPGRNPFMATAQLNTVLRHIHRVVGTPGVSELTDKQLLERFITGHEEAAFAALVRRHGPLVLGVCRRVLRHTQDAEDAFQATFMVLARKAASMRWHESVSNWLYEVAHRLALKVKAEAARRRLHERRAGEMVRSASKQEDAWREFCSLLDEELQRLPEKYRVPLLLCYLEGETREQAARQLGWSLRTFKRRLEQGRELLRVRLARSGLTLSGVLLATGLTGDVGKAAIPALLGSTTVRAALSFATNPTATTGGISANATLLAEGILKGMAMIKLKFAAAFVLAASLVGATVSVVGYQALAGQFGSSAPVADQASRKGATPASANQWQDPLPTGALVRLGTPRFHHGGPVLCVAFSPDGKLVASGSNFLDRTVSIWETATGREVHRLQGHQGWIWSVAFSPDGKLLASGSGDATIRLWDVATGQMVRQIQGHQQQINSLVFSPDGAMLASGSHDQTMRLWDVATGQEVRQFTGHERGVMSVRFTPDGKTLVSGSADGALRVWETATGRELRQMGDKQSFVTGIALSPDGKLLASGGTDNLRPEDETTTQPRSWKVHLWEVATGKALLKLEGHTNEVQFVAFSPDGTVLASSGRDQTVRLWNPTTGKSLRTLEGHGERVRALAFSPDGKTLASGSWDNTLRLWEVTTGKERPGFGPHQAWLTFMAYSTDGKTLMTGASDRNIRSWDMATGKLLREFKAHQERGRSVDLSVDHKLLATGSHEGMIHLWDPATGKEIRQFGQHQGPVQSVALSPDGKLLASGGKDSEIRIWDVLRGEELRLCPGHQQEISFVTFSPDGKMLASASADGTVRLWDVATGKELRKLLEEGNGDFIEVAVFSPNGKLLATGGISKPIRLFDVATGKLVRQIEDYQGTIARIAFSPDGRSLAAGTPQAVHVWETATGKERCRFVGGHRGWVHGMLFSPDGRTLISGSSDGTALVWDLTGRIRDGRLPVVDLSVADLETAWRDLAGDDTAKAYRALWSLAAASKQSLPLLREHLKPVSSPIDAARVQQFISELDNDQFAVREKAGKELEKLGEAAEPALRKALEKPSSPEAQRRLERLLESLNVQAASAERVHGARCLEVLEQIGSPEAQAVLQKLAAGTPGAWLTEEAKASLQRLTQRVTAAR